jgi:Zn-dependent protease with chaperone function
VLLIIATLYAITVMICGQKGTRLLVDHGWRIDERVLWTVIPLVSVVILFGCLIKLRQLSGGGRMVAIMMGGSPINPLTNNPDERRLCDVVQEMSIASGVPMPEIFVLRDEQGINSFVAGRTTEDTALAVTQGALKLLTRDELQGIIAHEFSHILNGDSALNMRMLVLLYGIISINLLGKLGWRIVRRFNDLRVWFFLGGASCVLMAIGWFGNLMARIIQCAVCRRREEMADAAAVQFTRNPEAIAGALKKIGGLAIGSHLLAVENSEAEYIFFSELTHGTSSGLLRSHPPLKQRIRLLDPAFNGNFPHVLTWRAQEQAKARAPLEPDAATAEAAWTIAIPLAAIRPGHLVPKHLEYAAALHASFDDQTCAAARDPFGASALVFAALLSPGETDRNRQLEEAAPVANPALLKQAVEDYPRLATLTAGQKLALMTLVLPALRQLSKTQFENFTQTVKILSESDRALTLFEFTLQKILLRHLRYTFKAEPIPVVQYYALVGLLPQCTILLSMLAWHGSQNPDEARSAFQEGVAALKEPTHKLDLMPRETCSLTAFDRALNTAGQAAMPIKTLILEACAATIAADGIVQEKEAQLLRAIAESLNCAIPPLLAGIEDSEKISGAVSVN